MVMLWRYFFLGMVVKEGHIFLSSNTHNLNLNMRKATNKSRLKGNVQTLSQYSSRSRNYEMKKKRDGQRPEVNKETLKLNV